MSTLNIPWLGNLVAGHPGLPTPQAERWKYTNLRGLTALPEAKRLASGIVTELPNAGREDAGFWRVARGLDNLKTLNDIDGDRGLARARSALPWDGLDAVLQAAPQLRQVRVAAGTTLAVNLNYTYGGGLGLDVLVLKVGANAILNLAENLTQASVPWVCQGLVIEAEVGAQINHRVQQSLPYDTTLTRREVVRLADGAHYHRGTTQYGAGLARFETLIEAQQNCRIVTRTLQHTGAEHMGQTHDSTVVVSHLGPGTHTEIHQRNVADGDGLAVFQGRFFVAQAAQQTDAYMRCQNLLLAGTARALHKPELEIYADDVKCSHGASTGGLDEAQLFYLAARGIQPAVARALVLQGFMADMLQAMPLGDRF